MSGRAVFAAGCVLAVAWSFAAVGTHRLLLPLLALACAAMLAGRWMEERGC